MGDHRAKLVAFRVSYRGELFEGHCRTVASQAVVQHDTQGFDPWDAAVVQHDAEVLDQWYEMECDMIEYLDSSSDSDSDYVMGSSSSSSSDTSLSS